MIERFVQATQSDGNRRKVEGGHVLGLRHLQKRPIDALRALGVAAVGMRPREQRQAHCDILGTILRQEQEVDKYFLGLTVQDKGLGPMTPSDRKVRTAFDEVGKRVDGAAIVAAVQESAS